MDVSRALNKVALALLAKRDVPVLPSGVGCDRVLNKHDLDRGHGPPPLKQVVHGHRQILRLALYVKLKHGLVCLLVHLARLEVAGKGLGSHA